MYTNFKNCSNTLVVDFRVHDYGISFHLRWVDTIRKIFCEIWLVSVVRVRIALEVSLWETGDSCHFFSVPNFSVDWRYLQNEVKCEDGSIADEYKNYLYLMPLYRHLSTGCACVLYGFMCKCGRNFCNQLFFPLSYPGFIVASLNELQSTTTDCKQTAAAAVRGVTQVKSCEDAIVRRHFALRPLQLISF